MMGPTERGFSLVAEETELTNGELSSPLRWLEISQIGRRLIFLGRHQKAVRAQEIVFLPDGDLRVVLGRIKFSPVRPRVRIVHVFLVDRPRTRQGMIDRGDLVMQDARISRVAVDALLEDRLI